MSQTKAQLVGGVGFSTADSLTVHNGLAVTGVVTATSFAGNITGNITGNATGLTGTPGIEVGIITATSAAFTDSISAASGTFTGNVTIGGTLTYEDVTSIDSIGIVTARTGVHFGLAGVGGSVSGAGNANFAGIVTATSFSGDGSNLSNTGSTLSEPSSGTERIVTTSLTSGTMTSSGTGAELAFDYANNHLEFSDNTKATFGTGNDLEIYHDGSRSVIKDSGTGSLEVLATNFVVKNAADNKNYIFGEDGGAVTLYHNNASKFATKSDGIDVTGEVQCDSLDVDGAADITGNVTLHANLDLQDDDKILLGTGDDLQIYHDGSHSYIDHQGTGNLYITHGSETMITANADGAVQLRYDNNIKFATKSDGIDVTGEVQCDSLDVDGAADITGNVTLHANLDLQDSDKILLGTGDDLQIYHNGSNSYIDDGSGTGALIFKSNAYSFRNAADSEQVAMFNENGSIDLYYDNSKKLETTSTGVTVTGDVNSTSDINLKKDIEVVTSATEMLNQLRGVKFIWKENDEKSVGVIAQEVEAILPELVRGEEGNKSVNYSGLIGVLIEAVKELSARVEELENK